MGSKALDDLLDWTSAAETSSPPSSPHHDSSDPEEALMQIRDHPTYGMLVSAMERQRALLGGSRASDAEQAFEDAVGCSVQSTRACALYIQQRVAVIESSIAQISALLGQLQGGGARVRMRVIEETRALVHASSSSPEQGEEEATDDEGEKKHKPLMSRQAQQTLTAWLKAHLDHPYPDDDEKDALLAHTGITVQQMNNWFVNARRRAVHRLRAEAARKKRSSVVGVWEDEPQ